MLIFKTRQGLQDYLNKHKEDGLKLAFVPTMGALHQGHISLVNQAKKNSDLVLVSIYVNPTQFNDIKDLEKYPRNQTVDIEILKKAGVDLAFIPKDKEMYPNGLETELNFSSKLFSVLEGEFRPGHFSGVCMIVKKLLDLIKPDILILGQKDLQQVLIIQELINFYKIPTKIQIAKIAREADGLAISSRNLRLTSAQRKQSTILSKLIFEAELELRSFIEKNQDPVKVLKKIKSLEKKTVKKVNQINYFKLEYFQIRNAKNLLELETVGKETEIAILIAGFISKIRLIDNEIIKLGIYF